MSRRKKRAYHRADEEKENSILGFDIPPETKRGIIVVFLFAISALMFLSFFNIAGSLGTIINNGLSQFFGFDRFLVPLVLIMIGATLAYPERGTFSSWNLIGLFFFFLSFNATLNLILVNRPNPFTQDLSSVGGYLGQFFGLVLPSFLGYWGAIVVTIAILLISVMLVFNTSLHKITFAHSHIIGLLMGLFRKRGVLEATEVSEATEVLDEREEEEEREENEEEHEFHATQLTATATKPETVLATKQRREIHIPLDLLDRSSGKAQSGDIERNKQIIEKTFQEFGIDVEMGDIAVGPTVTQYTLRPAQGIKLARVVSLQNDLALALAAHPIRMEAPIPGKSLVGIEVPNTKVAIVTLRDVMESKAYRERKGELAVPVGKDVSGNTLMISLAKMPHLLVAGATGSGKSVCLNTIILSLLYQYGPDDLKLILVDPKRVELTIYNGIPHLLVPPIVSVDDTVNALKWTVREMERRLDMLSKFGARNIDDYNTKIEERMPKIVVLIDELADLMSASGREVEATIVRIAQMARAVGIHLVLATQRPSVDVITGLIKANIPGRTAFAVASQTDSRTILDQSGAEKLLGRGDMLFTCAEFPKPKRLQGAFVSSEEIERVVSFLRKKDKPDYNMAITEITKAGTVFDNPEDGDPMLEESIQVVLRAGKASTSLLQRRLRIGYSRAARIMDLLEQSGVVGPPDGSRPREILIDEWPPWGNIKEGMPTMQDDYEEAMEEMEAKEVTEEMEEREEREEMEENEGSQEESKENWDDKIDDAWIK